MKNRSRVAGLAAFAAVLLPASVSNSPGGVASAGASPARSGITLERRIEARRAIEQVLWDHRIWPKDNPDPKPSLASVLSDEVLRQRAEDSLRQSNALAAMWKHPITPGHLQAEIERMVAGSKQPELLAEMFAALGNDPELIAECLARPLLADRLMRNWFAMDERFQGVLRRDIARGLEGVISLPADEAVRELERLGGQVSEGLWRRDVMAGGTAGTIEKGAVELRLREWDVLNSSLRSRFGRKAGEALPVLKMSELREDERAFSVVLVRESGADSIRTTTISWPKADFEAWWTEERRLFRAESPAAPAGTSSTSGYFLPEAAAGCTQDTWTHSQYGAPDPRTDHTAIWTGSEMIIWGGISWEETNRGGRYNPATDTWTATSTGANVPAIRTDQSALWTGTEMIIWGGSTTTGPLGDGGRYNPVTDTWTAMSTTGAPQARARHGAVWSGTRMIVWGGESGSSILGTGGVYNPSTDTWTATTNTGAPTVRTQLTAVWGGSVMIVWGGVDGSTYDTGGRYNPTTNTWAATTLTNVPQARYRHSAIWTGTRMIVWGGINGFTRLATGSIYDPVADTWVAMSTGANLPTGRASHTAVWTGTRMIVWGGTSGAGSLFTGGLFDPVANAWTGATSLVNNPVERIDHTAVWTGSRMVVWGGTGSGDVISGGRRYDPVTDTWTGVSMGAGILSARVGHTDVWTGSEMIVWGGWDGANINTGGRYDPATDTWSFMTTTNAPSARLSAMSVWTGSLFIVYGGTTTPAFSYFNTGGKYDVTNDSWAPTATALAPSGRAFGAAVWTGNRMVIWGGRNSSTHFNTGSRYDPVGNTWSATSVGGATPTGRSLYEGAVYTGTEMIVWGGNDGAAPTNTGGRYSPGANTWIAISPVAGTPSNREKNGIVWTGTEMIIFGGFSGTGVLGNGGRYTPSSNTWTPMTTVGAPGARQYPAMVWTGDRVLVWGGDNANAALNTGAKYDPGTDSWSNIPVVNAPLPQNAPEAVWTGSQMMVLGGASQVGMYCTCLTAVSYFHDFDFDSFGVPANPVSFCGPPPSGYSTVSTDCNDANGNIWGKPGEATGVTFSFPSTLNWVSPTTGGTSAGMIYDTLRSSNPSNFTVATTCVETDNGPNTTALDASVPSPGQSFFYLIRAQNACPTNNVGTLGFRSAGPERTGRTCP